MNNKKWIPTNYQKDRLISCTKKYIHKGYFLLTDFYIPPSDIKK